jgi:hypothetical protein
MRGERLGSNTQDQRINLKLGSTPNDTDEYVLNFIRQQGEKGAPLNVYNNPPVHGAGEFAELAPELPPIQRAWSPAARFGEYLEPQ